MFSASVSHFSSVWFHFLVLIGILLFLKMVMLRGDKGQALADRLHEEEAQRAEGTFFSGDNCPKCGAGHPLHPAPEEEHFTSYAAQAGRPFKLRCGACGGEVPGCYIPGLQM